MRKTDILLTLIAFFAIETPSPTFSDTAGSIADGKLDRADLSDPTSSTSKSITLDSQNRRGSFAGLDVFLLDDYTGPLPVIVRANCFGRPETPPLAIDATTFGENARLLNITSLPAHGCASYQVVAQVAAPAPSSNAPSVTSSGIAVSVHHAAPPPADAQFKDPAIFVFNPVHGNWTAAKSYSPSVPEPQRVYATLSEQSQRIIGGVIALPDSLQGQPARNDTSSLAEPLEQISPVDGYLAVKTIEPDNKGGYGFDLPLLLRPSRGPGPSFSIKYSSQGAPGVLGRGWDLHFSAIEVRGPSPIYNPAYETEDYLLDGMDLIALDGDGTDIPSLYKGGPIIPRISGVRVFRLRNNSGGLIVRRFGKEPRSYFWEVWDPNSHVTKLYGGEFTGNDSQPQASEVTTADGKLTFLKGTLAPPNGSIGQWGLTQEYDSQPARNGTRYSYAQDVAEKRGCNSSWGDDCRSALRLVRVEYSLAFGAAPASISASGVTRVEFAWNDRLPERFNSDGRFGFFRAQEYWLDELNVIYPHEPSSNLFRGASLNGDTVLQAALTTDEFAKYVLFAKHKFNLSDGNDGCMNFDTVLKSYDVTGNPSYDRFEVGASPATQTFKFDYEGQKPSQNNGCARDWSGGSPPELGKLPQNAVDGRIGFPAGLLSDLGFGMLTGKSLLGTSRTEETSGSLYVGIGLAGNTSAKDTTVGLKGGVNFSRTEGNSTLVDVTGDGIEDIVYRDQGKLAYCAGERQADENHSINYPEGRCGTIEGISDFSISSTSTLSVGVEVYPGFTSFAGIGFNSSKSNTYVYFTDRDGDGLIDLVAYGQVFYGQGEDRNQKIVRFVPRSSLTPPIPGNVSGRRLISRIPAEIRKTIKEAEVRLEALSRRLRKLEYTQTTLAWQAPMDGRIAITGKFSAGISKPDKENAGALGADFGSAEWAKLFGDVAGYQRDYIDPKTKCTIWGEADYCHDLSDPFGPHYGATPVQVSFVENHPANVQLSRFRKGKGVAACSKPQTLPDTEFDIGSVTIEPECRESDTGEQRIRVQTGDVIYLTYSVHPHFNKWLKPENVAIAYDQVDDDPLFNRRKSADQQKVIDVLGCKWEEQVAPGKSVDCLLAKQARYKFSLQTGTIATAPNSVVELPAGTNRVFGGRFDIPADLAADYQVYFEVLGAPRSLPDWPELPNPAQPPMPTFSGMPPSALQQLFQQDVSAICRGVTGVCTVDIKRPCDGANASACANFTGEYMLATRLNIQHRTAVTPPLPARDISARLGALTWRVPPNVSSTFTEKDAIPGFVGKTTTVYLPVSMGDPDIEYLRVDQGAFSNPDTKLTDTSSKIDFKDILSDEKQNVVLARLRQTVGLCTFADEIFGFLYSHFSQSGQPYADEYSDYWKAKIDVYHQRCDTSRNRLKAVQFLDGATPQGERPELAGNGLRLPALLMDLPYAQQITSAETLLERVLGNLALGEDLLTDGPRLTRRGYRLPMKVNPLDCEMLSKLGKFDTLKPIDTPIYGPEGPCAYRISANFSMQELEDLGISPAEAKNIRDFLSRFGASSRSAFEIELKATVNGKTLGFLELTGDSTGNEDCAPTTATKSCIRTYGVPDSDPVSDYFYPQRKGPAINDPHGDVFQRITVNKRTGRAVAFTNSIMDSRIRAQCPRNYPPYDGLGAMEIKQDCVQQHPGQPPEIDPSEKYKTQDESYRVVYTIGENNQFYGRNRVLEFRARPFDVMELHFQLSGVQNTVPRIVGSPQDTITGKFSIFDAVDHATPPPMGLVAGRHMIPRSPSQILPDGDFALDCPTAPPPPGLPGPPPPQTRDRVGSTRLPTTCRPWTRLGWTEVLFGAQYRTYSDAQKLVPGGASNTYSIERRREILRLQPEIEVKADEYVLENDGTNLPMVDEFQAGKPAQAQGEVFNRHDPVVAKAGGDWALFAAKANADGTLLLPPPFTQKPFVNPPGDPPLRFPKALSSQPQPTPTYDEARKSCASLDAAAPKFDDCENGLGSLGEQAVELINFRFFPLIHSFVGPANSDAAVKLRGVPQARPATSVCGVEAATAVASCWKGIDDTVFLEQAVLDQVAANEKDLYRTLYSASALKGFEKPPVAQFIFEFASYRKLTCLDPELPSGLACPAFQGSAGSSVELPNRPLPPLAERAIETFAPVQGSQSRAISLNVGAAYVNSDASVIDKRSTRLFQDVNGDGFPDVVSDGSVELTSPVGLSRRDWWNYFRARENVPAPDFQPQADGFESKATSRSGGFGIGLSASTFAQRPARNASGSPDVKVDPSFSVSLESGYDEEFTELRDFNGDGIADKIVGRTVDQGLKLQFNEGNGLRAQQDDLKVGGDQIKGVHYNTSHGAGFGVRLGFSFGAGSFAIGTGLDHRDNGSQAALMDFTGDGRPDIVLPANDGKGSLIVYPNLGNGFGKYRVYHLKDWKSQPLPELGGESGTALSETTLVDAGALYTTGFNVWFLKFVVTPGVKWARNQTRELLNIRDINGDGFPDVVAISGRFLPMPGGEDVQTQVHYNPDGKYHLLTGVTNPSGSRWILKHGLYGNSGPENGRAVWALTGVAHYDGYEPRLQGAAGATLPPDGQDVLLTTYDYSGGYYNRAERQFYGFAKRVSKLYGCDLGEAGQACLEAVGGIADLTDASLDIAKYRKLQTVEQAFANRDFLTQGLELSKSVSGSRSSPMATTAPDQAVSRNTFAYSIDNPSSLIDGSQGPCAAPTSGSADSWNSGRYSNESSRLSPTWDGSTSFGDNGKVFGNGSLCGSDVGNCAQTLAQKVCDAGFVREQRAFWAQQSGSVRQRLVTLETFGIAPAGDASRPDGGASDRLRSAVAFDHDQWGQVLTLDSVGEAISTWQPLDESSANATVTYTQRQALNSFRGTLPEPGFPMGRPIPGYPMLGLAGSLQIAAGPWKSGDDATPLRAREAIYSDNGRGNLTDICSYPGGEGFTFKSGICAAFRDNMQAALGDRYSTMQLALQAAYAKTAGLPKGVSQFNAIIHHQLVGYDQFGNLTHSISPLSQNKEWIERRFSYKNDPFRRQATSLKLTRCVNDVAGAGIDSPGLENDPEAKCSFGLETLPAPVLRKPITHASQSRIDTHFGVVAETRDINANSVLYDFDRWGRLSLIARSWGNAPRENRAFQDRLQLAIDKIDRATFRPDTKVRDWRLLALADYAGSSDGKGPLRSNLRRFETSESYSGLLSDGNTTRETAIFSDGLGRPVQSLREADVCLGVKPDFMDAGVNPTSTELRDRCTQTATGIVTPSTRIDALGRDLESFESYPIEAGSFRDGTPVRGDSKLRLTKLVPPPAQPTALTTSTYDAAGRPLLVESRLAHDDNSRPETVKGTTQYRYRIVREETGRGARFEALNLSPRCTATAMWSDARGLKRTGFEDQQNFYPLAAALPIGTPASPASYQRDYTKTRGYCAPIDDVAAPWEAAAAQAELNPGGQPARVSYTYDPLQQLTGVGYPLDGADRAAIAVRFDKLGRTLELQEPNSGCTRYVYDGLNSLMSETGFRYEGKSGGACGTTSKVRNEKTYTYAGGRLMQMSYHSLEEQGGAPDQRDVVHFYYDRYPYAALFGEILEALRLVPNDQANQRFIDVTSRKCDNCIGQPTIVSDRTGARSFSYNELGLPHREVRSIVAPVHEVKQSGGGSETYLPEIAFYQVDNSYTAFGSPVQEMFAESPPMNPAKACVDAGVYTCLASFSVGRKYAPDGAIAELSFNGRPLIRAAQDALGRPVVRWTSNGIATGYRYDPLDLRLNQMTTLLSAKRLGYTMPMQAQADGYQYDGGGNIVSYANRASTGDGYENDFEFQYDAANRLTRFGVLARKIDVSRKMSSDGIYAYDAGHRFKSRSLSITGDTATPFRRSWTYSYSNDPTQHPLHAPASINFAIGENSRAALLDYDDVGRMTRIGSGDTGNEKQFGLLSNRAMSWDAEGRLLRVRGVSDGAIPANEKLLREDYVYDSSGNRTLKIHHPLTRKEGDKQERELEAATVYMTPFYARPYDRRGTVQLSQGTLPAASLSPPEDQNEDPVVTYLYSDLPVGSMTAGVTVFGEPSDANASVIARREYSPYGLELTNESMANTKRDGVAPMSVFHGKELDRVTNFSSFGARSYSRDLGIWLGPDPAMSRYLSGGQERSVSWATNLATYSFTANNPVVFRDPTGLCASADLSGPETRCIDENFWQRNPTLASLAGGNTLALFHRKYGMPVNPLTGRGLTPTEEQNEKLMLLATVAFSVAGGVLAATEESLANSSIGKALSKEAERGIRSLEKRIAEHEKKLADFVANPTVRPGMEGQPKEIIEAAQKSRIQHLEKEIQTFKENIRKLLE